MSLPFADLIAQPPDRSPVEFRSAEKAVDHLALLYDEATDFLRDNFLRSAAGKGPAMRVRACYPEIRIRIRSFATIDSRLSFGHVSEPGVYATTITRPRLFETYLRQQIGLLVQNYGNPVKVGVSRTPIPIHFALQGLAEPVSTKGDGPGFTLRDRFDVPNLANINDDIANGEFPEPRDEVRPLAQFTAQRIDYSLARLQHYTATDPEYFQSLVLFTNYQFYVEEFINFARSALRDPASGYAAFVTPGNQVHKGRIPQFELPARPPQMPAYHLVREDGSGISLVNIGVGPSNAKTATDHIAVLRPRAWLMLGHCAGLRTGQSLGDYVLAHAYMREDRVLDRDLPVWIPVPALAEVQVALEEAVARVTEYSGYSLKRLMRTGTVATIDNRNWELQRTTGTMRRLSQARAIALDMESATVAANGFRFRVPYGTLLCVSDKPLHGELKLPGMAGEFYERQVKQHLKIGVKALESLRKMPLEHLHSRKLRSLDETAFL